MKRPSGVLLSVGALVAASIVPVAIGGAEASAAPASVRQYSVLATRVDTVAAAQKAIRAAGGSVLRVNTAVGLISASSSSAGFGAAVGRSAAVYGVSAVRPIGAAPVAKPISTVEAEGAIATERGKPGTPPPATAGMDPMDAGLWGLAAVHSDQARTVQAGDKRVLVGIIDTGVDGTHPDLAPNFDYVRSRNFAPDLPDIDGPCEYVGCLDPVDHDDGAHGTHVAGTIGAAVNGAGISGVAPNVTLVNVRAGQDSGYFFLQPVVDALTYSGDAGIDVVNMSFYVDPWLYNCQANPADSPADQAAQRTVIEAMSRAMTYAHSRGVTQVVSLGNQHTDLGNPLPDSSSPDYPPGAAYPRTIDNATCLSLPIEGPYSIGVSALGPSLRKADYSNYGTEQISVAAPGGWFRDGLGTPTYRTLDNEILSTYPRNIALAAGQIDADGNVTPAGQAAGVQRADFGNGQYGYYQYLQGTSMASPHAAGVSALIVSQYGHTTQKKKSPPQFGMSPDAVQRVLEGTAAERPCPDPPLMDYTTVGRSADFNALCEGTADFNGFYGYGIVDAYAAVTEGGAYL